MFNSIKYKRLSLKGFILIADYLTPGYIDHLQESSRPAFLCGRPCPKDLDGLQFGQLLRLQSISSLNDLLTIPASVVLGVEGAELMKAPVADAFGFSVWCAKEVEKIGKLFKEATGTPTPEERQAGIDQLNFGMFGMIDWYALRMGITNHEDVLSVSWLKVYQCLTIDTQKREFERRLRQVFSHKTVR